MNKQTKIKPSIKHFFHLLLPVLLLVSCGGGSSNGFTVSAIDNAGDVGNFTSIATGSIHISYYDWTNGNLKYITNASGSWVIDNSIDTSGTDVGSYSSIAVDSSKNVHIVYIELVVAGTLKYASNKTGSWVVEYPDTSGIDMEGNAAIAVESDGTAHISYYDWTNGNLKYATNPSGPWVIETPDASPNDVGDYSSIALDSTNNVHISYYDWDNGDLKYATNASGTWVTVTIDNSTDVGEYSSIAIDDSNNLHISYASYDNNNFIYSLKYATCPSIVDCTQAGKWNKQTVDSSGDVGEYSSIAAGSDGTVHISYYDADNRNLKYATR